MKFTFEVLYTSARSRARVGRITTPHGVIDTPNFVAVGTNGTLKALESVHTDDLGVQLMFCNTYHLMLQPGAQLVEQAGGLHRFINRRGPIITDSGGFQVFSLAYGSVHDEIKSRGTKKQDGTVLKINEEGVLFRSYRDGSPVLLTPETSVKAQKSLGADIIIPFDELPPYHIDQRALIRSFERTHRWQDRSLATHRADVRNQAMYGVVHGGIDRELRAKSCQFIAERAFDGFAIGGSVGKNRTEMVEMLSNVMHHIPPAAPVHLLGIGDLPSIDAIVPLGIDTFDSSYPTKAARHGLLLTAKGPVRVLQSSNRTAMGPIEEGCDCPTCLNGHSLAYIQHLFKAHEIAGLVLATVHNVRFMVRRMAQYRENILKGEI